MALCYIDGNPLLSLELVFVRTNATDVLDWAMGPRLTTV